MVFISDLGTALVVQWLRTCLAMEDTWVQSLVWELRSRMLQGDRAHTPQLERPRDASETLIATTKVNAAYTNKQIDKSYPVALGHVAQMVNDCVIIYNP